MHCGHFEPVTDRRRFLARAGAGFGLLAVGDLLGAGRARAEEELHTHPLAFRNPHSAPKATSIIWLFMEGAPSAVDLFDHKPELDRSDGKRIQIDVFNGN